MSDSHFYKYMRGETICVHRDTLGYCCTSKSTGGRAYCSTHKAIKQRKMADVEIPDSEEMYKALSSEPEFSAAVSIGGAMPRDYEVVSKQKRQKAAPATVMEAFKRSPVHILVARMLGTDAWLDVVRKRSPEQTTTAALKKLEIYLTQHASDPADKFPAGVTDTEYEILKAAGVSTQDFQAELAAGFYIWNRNAYFRWLVRGLSGEELNNLKMTFLDLVESDPEILGLLSKLDDPTRLFRHVKTIKIKELKNEIYTYERLTEPVAPEVQLEDMLYGTLAESICTLYYEKDRCPELPKDLNTKNLKTGIANVLKRIDIGKTKACEFNIEYAVTDCKKVIEKEIKEATVENKQLSSIRAAAVRIKDRMLTREPK